MNSILDPVQPNSHKMRYAKCYLRHVNRFPSHQLDLSYPFSGEVLESHVQSVLNSSERISNAEEMGKSNISFSNLSMSENCQNKVQTYEQQTR